MHDGLTRARNRPTWARWSEAAAARPWTVGIEEEVLLLDPGDRWSVANRIDDVLAALPPEVSTRASAETHACVIELRTAAEPTVALAEAELTQLRQSLDRVVRDVFGLRAASVGTHPTATRSEVALSPGARYQEIGATMGALARREPTMAQHVHVAVPDPASAVRAIDGLRSDLPLLLALSANSPFWRGSDSGFASIRTPIFSMFPRVGIARRFGSYDRYATIVDQMLRSGAVPDPGFLWWDARLRPHLGTVEIRIMDAQSRLTDAAALTAVVQCLVHRHAHTQQAPDADPDVLAENRFLAARDGIGAHLIDECAGGMRPALDALTELLDGCRRVAGGLGCSSELARAEALLRDPGAARQRRHVRLAGLAALPSWLAEQFAPTAQLTAAA
jgi:glutamate---cysteine ligase / carboxylate-amine ligase